MKNLSIYALLSVVLLGCGSQGSSDRTMSINEEYTVAKGEQVVKTSDNALVKIIHKDKSELSTVILLEGNATILPKK